MADRQVLTPITFNADLTIADATDVVLNTTTGTQIGTGTTQKLGFLGATPVAQQANTVDIVDVLENLGFRAAGGNPPLNLGSGALTAGATSVGTLAATDTITITDAKNIVVGTTTGTKIGTATGQKLGFFNATPVAQQANTVDLAVVLSNFGFRGAGGNIPLNLGSGGALTCGNLTSNGANANVVGLFAQSISSTGAITSSGGGVGYETGAGGTATQATSRITTVVLSKLCGTITLFSTTLAADTDVSFTWTNTLIAATDVVVTDIKSGAAVKGGYSVNVICGAGTATVTVHNHTPTITATEAPVISFVVIKGVTS